MFSTLKAHYAGNEKSYIEAACLSTDDKPTDGIANGSKCTEMDTGDIYMFDEAGGEWIKLGSGGGGDAEVWLVGNTYTDDGGYRLFDLKNANATDHMTELLSNGANYEVFLNGEELMYYPASGYVIWTDNTSNPTKTITIYSENSITKGIVDYPDASTAPDSVEVSVKAK